MPELRTPIAAIMMIVEAGLYVMHGASRQKRAKEETVAAPNDFCAAPNEF